MPRRRLPLLTSLLLLIAAVLLGACGASKPPATPAGYDPTVLLVSIDGFRWDYLDRYEAPALRHLAKDGVRASRLIPAFPTKTFPNHYTIVTGLHPAHHGIVSNTMYDPTFDARFRIGDPAAVTDARWWGGEPLWVTAERQGQKAASFFWPGSEAPIKDTRPSYWMPFDDDVPGETRVDQVLAWLDLPKAERPTFVTLYFSDVDHAGHDYGPDSDSVAAAIRHVDGYLERLVTGLRARGLYDVINLLVVSDHGMAATDTSRVIILDDYIDLADVRIVDRNPVLMAYAEEGRTDAVLAGLKRAPHLAVYRREEVPAYLNFRDHPRIPPIIAIADDGWSIVTREQFERLAAGHDSGGTHGYDHRLPSMGALFVAHGPAFKEGVVTAPFQNIHLYALMASILNLEPAPNDGRLDSVRAVLRDEPMGR